MSRLPKRLPTARNLYTRGPAIGEGGCGTVFRVTDVDGVARALKILDPEKATTVKRKRFKNEMDFCERNDHARIVKVLDTGAFEKGDEVYAFHVMPLYPATLRTRMQAGIAPAKVLDYFAFILDGIRWAHGKGTVHRDLKPENILCGDAIDDLVIADFGCARFMEEELATAITTRSNEHLGNAVYGAPEQAIRGRETGDRADVYALGCLLHEMFTGDVPRGTNPTTVASVAPEYAFIDGIVDAMRRQLPADRPSVDQVQVQLAAGLGNLASERAVRALQVPAPSDFPPDPLLDDPVRFMGFGYRSVRDLGYALLIYNLSSPVSVEWEQAFKRPATYRYLDGFDADKFEFSGTEGRVRISPTFEVQRHRTELESSFKQMLTNANNAYRQMVMSQRQAHERRREEARRQAIADERIRQALRG